MRSESDAYIIVSFIISWFHYRRIDFDSIITFNTDKTAAQFDVCSTSQSPAQAIPT